MALLLVLFAGAQDVEFGVGADAFYLKTTGTMKFDERPVVSDRLDLEDDLGHHHRDFQVGVHVLVSGAGHRGLLGFERWRMSWRHSLDQPAIFDGIAFPAGEPVRNRVALDRTKAQYDYELVGSQDGRVRIGIRAEYWLIEQVMETPTVGFVDDHLGTFILEPVVSATAGPFAGFSVDADLAGIVYQVLRHRVQTYEVKIAVRWSPTTFLDLSAGFRYGRYRFLDVDSMQHNEVAWVSSGPVASVEVRF
jgi:hypothetical protein